MERAVQALVDRHAALRTTFPVVDGEPRQRVAERPDFVFGREDVTGWNEERLRSRLAEEAWRPFDLETGPPCRVSLWTGAPSGPVLLLAIHRADRSTSRGARTSRRLLKRVRELTCSLTETEQGLAGTEHHQILAEWNDTGRERVYVLDKRQMPVPVGSWGELCIAGNGLARDEGERADRVAERFVPDAWSREVGGRLVRTGKISRHLPDGGWNSRTAWPIRSKSFRTSLTSRRAALDVKAHPP